MRADEASPADRKTILVVEHDEAVRRVVRTVLRRNGYRVLEAVDAGEAVLVCERHEDEIHLLLADVALPRGTGPRLGSAHPEMKVLLMQKPITPNALVRQVRAALATQAGSP